jgi:ribosomal RNA-processing protein 12
MSEIFSSSVEDPSSNMGSQLTEVLKVVLSSPPSKSDFVLSASWVQVLGGALVAYNTVDSKAASTELSKVWKSVWNFLDSSDAGTRKAAAASLTSITSCFTPDLIESAISDREGSSSIRKIIAQVSKALEALSYARAIPEILTIISSVITNLQHRDSKDSPTAAELLLSPLIIRIADLRITKGFEYKEAADATLAVAMRVLGPAVLLEMLPLNLEPASR